MVIAGQLGILAMSIMSSNLGTPGYAYTNNVTLQFSQTYMYEFEKPIPIGNDVNFLQYYPGKQQIDAELHFTVAFNNNSDYVCTIKSCFITSTVLMAQNSNAGNFAFTRYQAPAPQAAIRAFYDLVDLNSGTSTEQLNYNIDPFVVSNIDYIADNLKFGLNLGYYDSDSGSSYFQPYVQWTDDESTVHNFNTAANQIKIKPSGFLPAQGFNDSVSHQTDQFKFSVDQVNYIQNEVFSTYPPGNEYAEGYNQGFDLGHDYGYNDGYVDGHAVGYEAGEADGERTGYSQGYAVGYSDAESTDENVNSIFMGIAEIGLLPINIFLAIFNFEILGVNITGVVSALMSCLMVIIVLRMIMSGKGE